MTESLVIRIGGEAGWGLASMEEILSRLFLKWGYFVFSRKDYASQIKGGHNYHTLRLSKKMVKADSNKVDLLLALDDRTLQTHLPYLNKKALIIYDSAMNLKIPKEFNLISVAVQNLEKEVGGKNLRNALFLGALASALNLPLELLNKEITTFFAHRQELQQQMLKAASVSYRSVKPVCPLKKLSSHKNYSLLNGNEAVSAAAIKAGLQFHAQYPMTPVTGILHYLAKNSKEYHFTVVQPEDEISAINMALGASYAGARAMTATSGGGFALMVEALGLAGMAEIPLVIIMGQRPGPATGLPTKTEQGDLKFILSAAPGEFSRLVLAPGDVEECYTETKRAFYLAEKYQIPAIILLDKHLAESSQTIDLFKTEKQFKFEAQKKINLLTKVPNSCLNQDGIFKRYAFNHQFRTIPGTINGIYTCAGDEHDETGNITEDPQLRQKMMVRRMNKLSEMVKELPAPVLYGPEKAELTLVGWGSTKSVILELLDHFKEHQQKVNALIIKNLCPFQEEVRALLLKSKKLLLVENNYSGQLGQLIREKTGIEIKNKILRYDGNTFTIEQLSAEIHQQWLK